MGNRQLSGCKIPSALATGRTLVPSECYIYKSPITFVLALVPKIASANTKVTGSVISVVASNLILTKGKSLY